MTKPSRILNFHPLMASYGGWQLDDKDTECFHHARKFSRSALDGQPHFTERETEAHGEEPQGRTESEGGIRGGHAGWTVLVSPLMLGVERRERMVMCICVCVHEGCVQAPMCVQHGGICVCVHIQYSYICVCTRVSMYANICVCMAHTEGASINAHVCVRVYDSISRASLSQYLLSSSLYLPFSILVSLSECLPLCL